MNKLICPFCNETELEKGMELQGGGFILGCPKCKKFAHDIFWQELIRTKELLDIESSEHELCHDAMVKRTEEVDRTRKALDVAKDTLQRIQFRGSHSKFWVGKDDGTIALKALEQITALTKGDNNE